MQLVTRADVELLESKLCAADAARRSAELERSALARELDDVQREKRREANHLRIAKDELADEVELMRESLQSALEDNERLRNTTASLECTLDALKQRLSVAEPFPYEDDAAALQRCRVLLGCVEIGDPVEAPGNSRDPSASPGGIVSAPPGNYRTREEQLLAMVEKSAAMFLNLDREAKATEQELSRLRGEQRRWLSREFDLHAAIARLEKEREEYITHEVERSAATVVALQSLVCEESRERRLLCAQFTAELFESAFQRCHIGVALASKHLKERVESVQQERCREMRERETQWRLEAERDGVEVLRRHEHAVREFERRVEELRLENQKITLQNALLRTNCDEWRAQSERKDREHDDALERLRRDALHRLSALDASLRERDGALDALRREKERVELELHRTTSELLSSRQREENDRMRRANLRSIGSSTEPWESPEELRVRLLRSIESEDELGYRRGIASHPVHQVLLQEKERLTNDTRRLEDALLHEQARTHAADEARHEVEQRLATFQQEATETIRLLEMQRDAALARCELLAQQRQGLVDDTKGLCDKLSAMTAARDELASALGTRSEALDAAQATCQALRDDLAATSLREHKAREHAAASAQKVEALSRHLAVAHEKIGALERRGVEVEEELGRERLSGDVAVLLQQLEGIRAAFLEYAGCSENEPDDE